MARQPSYCKILNELKEAESSGSEDSLDEQNLSMKGIRVRSDVKLFRLIGLEIVSDLIDIKICTIFANFRQAYCYHMPLEIFKSHSYR